MTMKIRRIQKKAASFEAAFVVGSSLELGLDHELHDASGSCRALEVSIRTAWRRHRSGDLAERTRRQVSIRSEEHTSELQSHSDLVCRLLLEKKKTKSIQYVYPVQMSTTTT